VWRAKRDTGCSGRRMDVPFHAMKARRTSFIASAYRVGQTLMVCCLSMVPPTVFGQIVLTTAQTAKRVPPSVVVIQGKAESGKMLTRLLTLPVAFGQVLGYRVVLSSASKVMTPVEWETNQYLAKPRTGTSTVGHPFFRERSVPRDGRTRWRVRREAVLRRQEEPSAPACRPQEITLRMLDKDDRVNRW
jgi:hypothetical protein